MKAPNGRPCRVCSHPDRDAIEQAIVNGKSYREVSRTFRIGYHPEDPDRFSPDHKLVTRHVDEHMADAYRAAVADEVVQVGRVLLERLDGLDAVMDEQVERLRTGEVVMSDGVPLLNPDGSPRRRFAEADIRGAVREARRNLELRSRLAGVTPEGDPDAAADARRALGQPEVRRMVSELEAMLDHHAPPVQGN